MKGGTRSFRRDRRAAATPCRWRRQHHASHFYSPLPPRSSPTVVMVSLTSVSPLLYASPNINRQTTSLISRIRHHERTGAASIARRPPHLAGDRQRLSADRDEQRCRDDDDPLSTVTVLKRGKKTKCKYTDELITRDSTSTRKPLVGLRTPHPPTQHPLIHLICSNKIH